MREELGLLHAERATREARVLRDATSVGMMAQRRHMPEQVGMILAQSHRVIRLLDGKLCAPEIRKRNQKTLE